MTNSAHDGQRSFKVPKTNNRFLCWPSANQSRDLMDHNRAIFQRSGICDWFLNLRELSRHQAIQTTQQYLSEYAPSLLDQMRNKEPGLTRLVVGGHQPELFHPGVWFKNFLLSRIGQKTDSLSLHVTIDHDVARSDSLRVPLCVPVANRSHTPNEYFQRSISLPIRPDSQPRMPWHTTLTKHGRPEAWKETILQIRKSLSSCGLHHPILVDRSKLLDECIRDCTNFSEVFSRFRHRIELENGVCNLEVPMGRLCNGSAFGLFVHYCIRNAESLWHDYNNCRTEYRKSHKIRNQAQPVLQLQRKGDFFELPFWIYGEKDGEYVDRKRLWICEDRADSFLLCDHADAELRTISIALPKDESSLATRWRELVERGVCIRPRALMTTMYLRCFVADLFVHGIGGGTYDALTDSIIERWLGIEPPKYLTCSASLFLPFPQSNSQNTSDTDGPGLRRELQLMRSVPERFLDQSVEAERVLYLSHAALLSNIPPRGKKSQWHQELSAIKNRIESSIANQKQALHLRQESLFHQSQQDKIRMSRDFSFVLFNERDAVMRLSKLAAEAV